MGVKQYNPHVKIGDYFWAWFGDSKVLDILPYTGRYPEHFNCVLRLEALPPKTRRGHVEMAYKNPEVKLYGRL